MRLQRRTHNWSAGLRAGGSEGRPVGRPCCRREAGPGLRAVHGARTAGRDSWHGRLRGERAGPGGRRERGAMADSAAPAPACLAASPSPGHTRTHSRGGSPAPPPVLLAPSFLTSRTAKTGFFFLAERASSLKKRAEGAFFFPVRYRLNEGSAVACNQIVVQFTGPRSGVNNRPGRSGPRPTARRPADHLPGNFPVSLWAKPENGPVRCGQSPKDLLVRYGLNDKIKQNQTAIVHFNASQKKG